jgi:hypothetical protein
MVTGQWQGRGVDVALAAAISAVNPNQPAVADQISKGDCWHCETNYFELLSIILDGFDESNDDYATSLNCAHSLYQAGGRFARSKHLTSTRLGW